MARRGFGHPATLLCLCLITTVDSYEHSFDCKSLTRFYSECRAWNPFHSFFKHSTQRTTAATPKVPPSQSSPILVQLPGRAHSVNSHRSPLERIRPRIELFDPKKLEFEVVFLKQHPTTNKFNMIGMNTVRNIIILHWKRMYWKCSLGLCVFLGDLNLARPQRVHT